MRSLPPQRGSGTLLEPVELITRLSEDLERAIAFAEECRWRFPELHAEAERLSAQAMALFGSAMRSMRESDARSA